MSDDGSAVHAQTSAIFEKLYDERGQPDKLDDAFIQEYFKLIKDHVKLDVEEAEVGPLVEESTEVKLSKPDSGLIEIYFRAAKEKYIVSRLPPVNTIQVPAFRIGQRTAIGPYTLTNSRGFITITLGTSRGFIALLFPTKFEPVPITEKGEGEWVPVDD